MENKTSLIEFHMLPFSINDNDKPKIFSIFCLIYLFGVMVNLIIITVICLDSHLHTPMYLFLCNLSIVDLCYTTVTVPKLLDMLRSWNNAVPYPECIIQVYFFSLAATSEAILLFIMGFDRFIAICHPLHYNQILSHKICILIMTNIWICSVLNSVLLLYSVLQMSFCRTLTIHQFFCDPKALISISCSGSNEFNIITYINVLLFGVAPLFSNLMSYMKIIRIILHIKTTDGRRKAFSTCLSHISVISLYYINCLSIYLMPPSDQPNVLEQILTVFYTTVIPMVNPLIYSLRNNEIKSALHRLVSWHGKTILIQ